MNVVWFKRDLRINDHAPLMMAIKHDKIIPLYILEPELWQQPDLSFRHYKFLSECLLALNEEFQKIGHKLIIKVGDALNIFNKIHKEHSIKTLYSHQETWNYWSYKRNKMVAKWLKENNIKWVEFPNNGVVRDIKSRDKWSQNWYKEMTKSIIPAPSYMESINILSDILPSAEDLKLSDNQYIASQIGGRSTAMKFLNTFLYDRGEKYYKEISSPISAVKSCSRISPYLAFGVLSMREIFQSVEKRVFEIKQKASEHRGKWLISLRSFSSRLRWHCHFIQKLEDQPNIEFTNMNSYYDGLRENSFNNEYYEAWKIGKTGYPMIDSCLRSLITTGWINFRMRAMLMSFASYHLWLHWHKTSLYLSNLFLDYEPGIHYSQTQMQSGTTGKNSIRIYNPIKQGVDHDPKGIFIKKWIPELCDMPEEYIHTPWEHTNKIKSYPLPIVNEKEVRKYAMRMLYSLRRESDHKELNKHILDKHGSRKPGIKKMKKKKTTSNLIINQQKELIL